LHEAESSKIEQPVIIEVVSTLKKHLYIQSDVQSMKIDSEPFKRFMEIKEKGKNLKRIFFPKFMTQKLHIPECFLLWILKMGN
jgi:hypothetical protein